jgi:uncharacterized protein (TIGR02452 family)
MGKYKSLALENESIIAAGYYANARGARVDLAAGVSAACQGTRSYSPEQTLRLFRDQTANAGSVSEAPHQETAFEVTGETSTQAGQRLVLTEGATDVAILNFASARNPGGGYLGGARAQEEDLCRSSALYTTLLEARDYYDAHRTNRDTRYSHRVIFSPGVPVYRDSATRLLDASYQISYLTSPAPNAGVLIRHDPAAADEIEGLLVERAGRVLAVAAHHGVRTLVLGAWGCGVFGNDPATVARAFRRHLADGGVFEGRFARVVFAVYDTSSAKTTLGAFQTTFASLVSQDSAASSASLSRSQ